MKLGRGTSEAADPRKRPARDRAQDRLSSRGLLLLTAFVFTFVQRRFYSKPYDRMNFLLPIGNMVYYADRVSNTKHLCVPRVNPARGGCCSWLFAGFPRLVLCGRFLSVFVEDSLCRFAVI